ncbi:FlhC family transcriptional regulator [Pseudoduganella violacea]|uniref:Flagellar transcriptional activator FlhC n=1 Tax=Pseudoduganella violacea TaxID=1715466 RepID=A0A7W5BHA5_9BURK|nr:flagellar transcriptional activator FlhC [Pseudoduganella violacea]
MDTHIRALQLAKSCVALGARIRTVSRITGLSMSLLRDYFYREVPSASGRWPESCDWYHLGSTIERAEASVFGAICATLLAEQLCRPGEALVAAYRMYAERCTAAPRISFERAFNLVCDLEGIWNCSSPQLALRACAICHSRYLVSLGDCSGDQSGCVFCKLLKRYWRDTRIQAHYLPLAAPADLLDWPAWPSLDESTP